MRVFSIALSSLALVSSVFAAPTGCSVALEGNLSPNGVYGNFKLVNNNLVFDPTNLAYGFDIALQSCGASTNSAESGYNPSGLLTTTTGQCLAAQNGAVVGVDCSNASMQGSMTWKYTSGFLFWSGASTAACPSGLYGYVATGSSGTPEAVQKGPITLGCESAGQVFPFSILM